MSAFYGSVEGQAKTIATRRGSKDITVSAQSWNGSIITRLYYNNDDLMVDLRIGEGSTAGGITVYSGTFSKFKTLFIKKG